MAEENTKTLNQSDLGTFLDKIHENDILRNSGFNHHCLRGTGYFNRASDLIRKRFNEDRLNEKGYGLEEKADSSGHRWGDGGESETILRIKMADKDLLSLSYFKSYTTTSDDFVDYSNPDRITVLLHDDDNGLVRRLFEELKAMKIDSSETYNSG